jgi:hypothetical protein
MISAGTARWLSLAVAALLAAGCASFELINPGRQSIGGVISVEPGVRWSKFAMSDYQGKVEVWTLDGPVLNTLLFFTGVGDGEPLFVRRGPFEGARQKDEKPAVFRSAMNSLEIKELVEATLARQYRTTIVEAHGLQPARVAEGDGFRFNTRLVGQDEVERSGVFVGTVRNRKLYGAWFQGAKLHYYERYLPEFEGLASSMRLAGEAAR